MGRSSNRHVFSLSMLNMCFFKGKDKDKDKLNKDEF